VPTSSPHPSDTSGPACLLCGGNDVRLFAEVDGRRYHRCAICRLTFQDSEQHPTAEEERVRYETHENDPEDPDYRAFLHRLAGPLLDRLPPAREGLDYGSGPGPTLSVMMEEAGHSMALWDPFFAPDPTPLQRTWDFVTCTETAEHFHRPGEAFQRLDALLRRPGWLGLMTGVLEDDEGFAEWWYRRDPTHVVFYRPETLSWIADRFGWELERPSSTVALFRKE